MSLRNRSAGRRGRHNACARQTWQGYYLRVLSWSSLNTYVLWSFTKRSVWRKVTFGENLFQTKLLSRLSHKVCRLLSSPVLLRKFTNINRRLRDDWDQTWFAATTRRPQRLTITKLFPFGGNWTLFLVQVLRIKNVTFCKATRLPCYVVANLEFN